MLSHMMMRSGGLMIAIDAVMTNANLFALAGSPTYPVDLLVTIESGVSIGSVTSAVASLDIGQFAAGSDITINNHGAILAAGGLAGASGGGGAGGDAIRADYPNQKVTINNHGEIKGGGGGSGRGGNGGTGGKGGNGYYQAWVAYYSTAVPYNFWRNQANGTNTSAWRNGTIVVSDGSAQITSSGNYRRGALRRTYSYTFSENSYTGYEYNIEQLTTYYTTGGNGGGGGAGAAGRPGQGYNQAAGGAVAGAAGANGAAGGANAGAGGKGGTGGTAAAGGAYGANGGTSGAGATGSTGASGNNGGGSAGTGGAAASPPGTAGRYVLKGTANVVINNFGTVAGTVA